MLISFGYLFCFFILSCPNHRAFAIKPVFKFDGDLFFTRLVLLAWSIVSISMYLFFLSLNGLQCGSLAPVSVLRVQSYDDFLT